MISPIHFTMVNVWYQIAYKHDVPKTVLKRQLGVLEEEVNELLLAIKNNDLEEKLDAFCDISWVAMMVLSAIDKAKDAKQFVDMHKDITPFDYFNNGVLSWEESLSNDIKRQLLEINNLVPNEILDHFLNMETPALVSPLIRLIKLCACGIKLVIANQVKISYSDIADEEERFHYMNRVLSKWDFDPIIESLFNEVIFSNYSKTVGGQLPKDATGKVSKKEAIEKGLYQKPDLYFIANKVENEIKLDMATFVRSIRR